MEALVTTIVRASLELLYKVASFFIRIWLLPLNSILEWSRDRIKPLLDPLVSFFTQNKTKLLRISIYSVIAFILIGSISLANYFIIYSYYVPKVSTEEPLYFDFGKKISASAEIAVEFQRNKLYDIYLHLELPESPKNEAAGMFMACIDIDNQDKWNPQKILHTCRPAILKYRSTVNKFLRNCVFAFTNLFGFTEEKQIISIPMVENLLSKRFYQTISVNVNIQNPEVQIYKASLIFQAKLSGAEYYLYHYPYTSFVIGVSFLFVFWTIVTLFMATSLYIYRYFKNPPPAREELDVFPFDSNKQLSDEEKKKKELYNDLSEILNPLPAAPHHTNPVLSPPTKPEYIWEEEIKEIDDLISRKKQLNDSNNNNYFGSIESDDSSSGIKIGNDITKSMVSPEVQVEKIVETESLTMPGSHIINSSNLSDDEKTPFATDESTPLLQVIDSEESTKDESDITTPTTDTPSPPSSDGESYGNSGNLGHDEWQIVGSSKDEDESQSTIRKRKA